MVFEVVVTKVSPKFQDCGDAAPAGEQREMPGRALPANAPQVGGRTKGESRCPHLLKKESAHIICDQLAVEPEKVTLTASFIDDLGADSLDIVELVMTMEEEFDLDIPDEDAEKMKTVGDVVKYVASKSNH